MSRLIPTPSPRNLLTPLLASLPAAAVSTQPPAALLPLLSPTLRQRIQFLSSASHDPWLPLLCFDQEKASQLTQIAKSDRFEPHPVSGEVEVDWDGGIETRYQRIDVETLEAHVLLEIFELSVKLLWCIGDQDGGGDGWRIGKVSVLDIASSSEKAGQGCETIDDAESRFMEAARQQTAYRTNDSLKTNHLTKGANGSAQSLALSDEEEDDDAYWAQYDSTPARTPALNRSPEPTSTHPLQVQSHDAENAYYAQYASVQPAMDAHDPDEATQNDTVESTLGQQHDKTRFLPLFSHDHPDLSESSMVWNNDRLMPILAHFDDHIPSTQPYSSKTRDPKTMSRETNGEPEIAQPQPRPTSSSSSSSASMIVKLENTAAAQVQAEVGIKQHISTSIKSMFRLAKAVGVERLEFERLVMVELECLGMEDDESN